MCTSLPSDIYRLVLNIARREVVADKVVESIVGPLQHIIVTNNVELTYPGYQYSTPYLVSSCPDILCIVSYHTPHTGAHSYIVSRVWYDLPSYEAVYLCGVEVIHLIIPALSPPTPVSPGAPDCAPGYILPCSSTCYRGPVLSSCRFMKTRVHLILLENTVTLVCPCLGYGCKFLIPFLKYYSSMSKHVYRVI